MNSIIIHTISKEEIEALDFTRFEIAFGNWPQLTGEALRSHFDSLTLLVDGYNHRVDEIYAIPEVRRYFAELHRRWPWWLYFLKNFEANIAVYYMCLLQRVECFKEAGAPSCAAAFNPDELWAIIGHDFCRMNYLFERAGLSDAENDRRSDEILKIFTKNMGGVDNE